MLREVKVTFSSVVQWAQPQPESPRASNPSSQSLAHPLLSLALYLFIHRTNARGWTKGLLGPFSNDSDRSFPLFWPHPLYSTYAPMIAPDGAGVPQP